MENRSGIISLSFPFAAGVTAAAIAAQPFHTAVSASTAAALLLIWCAASSKRSTVPLMLLFFCLGAVCWCNSALCPPPERHFPSGPMDTLTRLLDGIPFEGEHSGAIIKALLTGRRDSLPRETVTAFRKSGAAHILALSGLHLGIIYVCIRRALSPVGNSPAARSVRSLVTIALCGLYAGATGASPSITRAFLFICINEIAGSLSARARSPIGTLCIALTLHLAGRPDQISSAGFQLSYLALLGITLLYPKLESWYPESGRRDPLRAIWKSAALSVSCQVFTAPVVWARFHSFPLFFLITNLIALPLAELTIITAVAAVVLEAVCGCPPALAWACGKLASTMEFCLDTIAGF